MNNNIGQIQQKTEKVIQTEWKGVGKRSEEYLKDLNSIYNDTDQKKKTNLRIHQQTQQKNIVRMQKTLTDIQKKILNTTKEDVFDINKADIRSTRGSLNRSYSRLTNKDGKERFKNSKYTSKSTYKGQINDLKRQIDALNKLLAIKEKQELSNLKKKIDKGEEQQLFTHYSTVKQDIEKYTLFMSLSDQFTQKSLKAQFEYNNWLNQNFFKRDIIYTFEKDGKLIFKTEKEFTEFISKNAVAGKNNLGTGLINYSAKNHLDFLNFSNPDFVATDEQKSILSQPVGERYDRVELLVDAIVNNLKSSDIADKLKSFKHNSIPGFLTEDVLSLNHPDTSFAVKSLNSNKFYTANIAPSIYFAIVATKTSQLNLSGTDFVTAENPYTKLFEELINSNNFQRLSEEEAQNIINSIISEALKSK